MITNNPKQKLGDLKDPLAAIPMGALAPVARALQSGHVKYGRKNWRAEPVSMTTYQSAFLRHITAWSEGEDYDEDTGEHHLAHVAAGCLMVLDAINYGTLVDDRCLDGEVLE